MPLPATFVNDADVLWLSEDERARRGKRGGVKTVDLARNGPFEWPSRGVTSPTRGGRSYVEVREGQAQDRPDTELRGSMWDRDRMFGYYEDGKVFMDPVWAVSDIESMIRIDGKVRSMEEALTLPLRMATWKLVGQKGDTGELELVERILTADVNDGGMATPIQGFLNSAFNAALFKRSHFERQYKVLSDGTLGLGGLWYRMPATCYMARWGTDGMFAGMMQWTWKDEAFQRILIPPQNTWVFLHGQHRNQMEGVSDLELAYQVHKTKQKLIFLWLQYLETVSLPRALAKHSNNNRDEARDFAQDVKNLKRGGVIGLIAGQDVTPFESGRGGETEFHEAVNYLDSQMTGSILAGFLDLTGAAASLGRGSMALSQDQSRFYLNMRQAALTECASQFTYGTPDGIPGVISEICRWNKGVKAKVPQLQFDSLLQTDIIDKTVGLLQALVAAPNVILPWGIIDLLVEKTADYLGLDQARVAIALTSDTRKPSETPFESTGGMGAKPPGVLPPAPSAMQRASDRSGNPDLAKVGAAVGRAHAMLQQAGAAPGPQNPNGSGG